MKGGAIPALPLPIRAPQRIIGLLVLLPALQVLMLLELLARRSLTECRDELAGLVPGNPQMKTARSTAERLLAAFSKRMAPDDAPIMNQRRGYRILMLLIRLV